MQLILKHRVFWLILALVCFCQVSNAEKPKVALITINNYSGVDKVGGSRLVETVDDLFVKNIKKQPSLELSDLDQTKGALKKSSLEVYFEAANLCNNLDIARIGRKIGVSQVLTLEINGYSEIKREKSKKSYQLLLALKVVDANSGSQTEYFGEGFSDGDSEAVFTNAVSQLINNYLNLQVNDPSTGNLRANNIQVMGNKSRRFYHLLQNHHQPKPENQILFNSRIEAEQSNYLPCPICFPGYKSFSYSDRNLEEALGNEACGMVEYYYRLYDNPTIMAWINRVAAPLIADTIRKNREYKFRILDTEEFNAFAAPNGYIYITKGLLDSIESDEELAFVISHEMGHIEKKHSVIMYKRAQTAVIFASILIAASGSNSNNSNDQVAAAIVTNVILNMIFKGYSREHEREADALALSHLKRTGMDQKIYLALFGRFIDMRQQKLYAIDRLFATHPSPEDRIGYLDKCLQDYNDLQLKLGSI